MDRDIVAIVRSRIKKLTHVLALLESTGDASGTTEPTKRTRKRKMSAAGRKRISMAQKARWAKLRKA
jgi:hypothetical protein